MKFDVTYTVTNFSGTREVANYTNPVEAGSLRDLLLMVIDTLPYNAALGTETTGITVRPHGTV